MSGPRIATLTVNPAVDVAAEASEVRPVHKIRTFGDRYDPGGGGINVARVVHELGGDTTAVFAAGGVTGRFVEEMLSQAGVPTSCIPIRGPTRISLTVREQASGSEYRFVPQGPRLDSAECTTILRVLDAIDADWLVASGSLPPGVPADFYASVAQTAARRGIKFALDTSGPALRASLGCGIDLLKPSLGEFESIVGREYSKASSRATRAVELVRSGAARMIALTLGGDGAILATADGALQLPAMAVKERTGVGAGDSFLAGLVLGLARGQPHEEALRLAIAAGAAAVAGIGTARVQRAEVEALYRGSRTESAALPIRTPLFGA
jgi:6-phosphofructokinase 2